MFATPRQHHYYDSQHHAEKLLNYHRQENEAKKYRIVRKELSLALEKNEGYMPGSLGGRLNVWACRRSRPETTNFAIRQLQFRDL